MRTSTLLHNGGASRPPNSFASWPCHTTEVEVFEPMGAGDSFAGFGVFHWKDDPCGWGQSDPDQPRFGKDISFGATAYESLKGWWFHSFKRGFADFTPWGQLRPSMMTCVWLEV